MTTSPDLATDFLTLSHHIVSSLPIRKKTRATYRSVLRNHLNPVFGNQEITSISRSDIQRVISYLPPQTAATTLAVMKTIYREAQSRSLIGSSPAHGVSGPINMKLNRVQRYPIEPFDYLTTLPNSPVWGTIGTTTAFDVTQKSVVDSSVTGAFTAIATYADGSTANISNLIRDSIQQKVAADRLAVEQRAAADRLAAEQRAAADRLAAEQRAAADRLALEQKAVADRLAAQKTTITCVKGKLIKKVTGSKPKCPAGYKLKK
jgi:hypothetical protein